MRSGGFFVVSCLLSLSLACTDKAGGADSGDAGGSDGGADTGDGGGTEPAHDDDHDGYDTTTDCDDLDGAVHPAAPEVCDGVDNNCDERVDEGFDVDGDGYLSAAECEAGDDCDDADASISPSADEVPYDDVDQDCDGADLIDVDGDGFDASESGGNDCDDTDASVFPGGEDLPKDGIDQDCDGADNIDGDGDGYGDDTLGGDDCDDESADVHPGALDWMNDGDDVDCDDRDGALAELADVPVTIDGTSGEHEYLGNSMVVCDLDADGLDDVILTAPFANTYAGQVGVFYGANAASWSSGMAIGDADVLIESESFFLGFGVDCGDVDGDGLADLAVGRAAFNGDGSYGFSSAFGVVVFTGAGGWSSSMSERDAAGEISFDLEAVADDGYLYTREFRLLDVEGDGVDELIVNMLVGSSNDGTPQAGDSSAWLLDVSAVSGRADMDNYLYYQLFSDVEDALRVVATGPDRDGDGAGDMVFGQSSYSVGEDEDILYTGRISLLAGVPEDDGTLEDIADATIDAETEILLGYTLAFGDFDGDSLEDLVTSGPLHDVGGNEDAGRLFLVSDAANSVVAGSQFITDIASTDVLGSTGSAFLGATLVVVSDLNGDGSDDVLVSEPGAGLSADGRVLLMGGAYLTGSGRSAMDVALFGWNAEDADDSAGGGMATGDFDGDGHTDLVITARSWGYSTSGAATGRVYVVLSSQYGW